MCKLETTDHGLESCRGRRVSAALFFAALLACAGAGAQDPAQLLADVTGTTISTAQSTIQDISGTDPATLLEGLSAAEAEELLELVADLAGLGAAPGEHTVGIATPELREMARTLEYELADHLWSENMVPLIFYGTSERLPGDVVSWFTSHVSLSSGMYLGGVSCRYALAKHKRDRAKNNGQRNVWQKEMNRAKAMVDYLVEGQHRNINIGRNWTGPNGRSSGTDYLLPYYMLRYFTEGKVPNYDPFPAYHGPTTR